MQQRAARWQAVLDVEAKWKAEAEETGTELGGGLPLKQKERAEGEQVICDCCVTWGAKCQVSGFFYYVLSSADNG